MSYFVQVPAGPDRGAERRSAHFEEPLLLERWGVARAISLWFNFVCGSHRPRSLSPFVTLEASTRSPPPPVAMLKEEQGGTEERGV